MIRRWIRLVLVGSVAWAARRVPDADLRAAVDRAWPRRDQAWRDALIEDARLRNRARTMQEIG